jgi:uncharacterized protein DUF2586
MSLQVVNVNELDGALGTLPAGLVPLAFVGVADSGPIATPAAYARTKDLVSTFGGGPTVEAAAYFIKNYGRPVVFVRTGNTVVGTHTNINVTGVTGTSVVTITGADTNPNDDYEPWFKVVTGGTIGVAGITFFWSLDGGRTLSPLTALGTATSFVFPGSGGIGYSFAAGTLLANDTVFSRALAPNWNTTELGTALTALQNTTINWKIAHIIGPIDASSFDTIATSFAAGAMSEKMWLGSTRMPTVGETEAAYKTALDTIFSAKANNFGGLAAGATKTTSGVNFRQYKRPFGFSAWARQGSVSLELDISQIDLGALPGIDIRDANGNPDEHDEFVNPGLDDSRFTVARTWQDVQGVYVNNPRIFSATGSDFEFTQHRLVMNEAKKAARLYFQRRLSKAIRVSLATGFILEEEALEIEAGANAAVSAVLMAKPMASGGGHGASEGRPAGDFIRISRTDNILSTKTITVVGAIVPLAYPKVVNFDIGFRNPSLQVVSV